MAGPGRNLLGGTGLTGYRVIKILEGIIVFYYFPHSCVDDIPFIVGNIHSSLQLRCVVFDEVSFGVCNFIKKGQRINVSPACDCGGVARQL